MFSDEQQQLIDDRIEMFDITFLVDGYEILKPNNKITTRIPYSLKEGENKDNITVFLLANDGSIKNMVGQFNEETGEATRGEAAAIIYRVLNWMLNY